LREALPKQVGLNKTAALFHGFILRLIREPCASNRPAASPIFRVASGTFEKTLNRGNLLIALKINEISEE
jgi:signal peptidase I